MFCEFEFRVYILFRILYCHLYERNSFSSRRTLCILLLRSKFFREALDDFSMESS